VSSQRGASAWRVAAEIPKPSSSAASVVAVAMVGRCNVYSLSLFGVVEQRSPELRYCHTL
jgi:hypothetical protein